MKNYESYDQDSRVEVLLRNYDVYIEKSYFDHALQVVKELVAIRGQAQDYSMQGFCQSALGHSEEAFVSFKKVIELDPYDAVAWTNLGALLNCFGRYDHAFMCLAQAIELDPSNIEFLFDKGTVLNNLGHHKEALTDLNRVLELNPNFQIAWTNRGLALGNLGRYEEALDSFDKALKLDPKDRVALSSRGKVLVSLGNPEEALKSFHRLIELEPNDPQVWLSRSIVLANLGRYDKALVSIKHTIELDPADPEAWGCQSLVLGELERYEEALVSCNQSIELGEQAAAVFLNRAKALLALDNWNEGSAALDEALGRFAHADPLDPRHTEAIIRNLFNKTHDAATWRLHIKTLVEIYDEHQFAPALKQGFIKSISVLLSPKVSEAVAQTWRDVWQELVSDCSEFQIPLCLLNAAIRYRKTKGDPRVLLELSTEERNLFRALLGVEEPQNQLNETDLLYEAALMALIAYPRLGRGIVCVIGEEPHYLPRYNDIPEEALALIDGYSPEQEFLLLIPSKHSRCFLCEFAAFGLDPTAETESISEEKYNQELEAILAQLREKGLDPITVDGLRQMTLAFNRGEISLAGYPPEAIAISEAFFNFLRKGRQF